MTRLRRPQSGLLPAGRSIAGLMLSFFAMTACEQIDQYRANLDSERIHAQSRAQFESYRDLIKQPEADIKSPPDDSKHPEAAAILLLSRT